MNTLKGTVRSKADKLGDIRSNGMIPAVVYGASVKNTTISVPTIDFKKVLKTAGETTIVSLEIDDKKTKKIINALIHEVQVDPVKGFPIHVDFLSVDMNKTVEVEVPIEFVGIAPAEKNGLGVLVKALHNFEIEVLPKEIPNSIAVDLSPLENLDSQIHVSDVKLPKGVKMLTNSEEVVALITLMKEEEPEEESNVEDLSAIEVEKKGKADEGEEIAENSSSEDKKS